MWGTGKQLRISIWPSKLMPANARVSDVLGGSDGLCVPIRVPITFDWLSGRRL